MAKQRQNKTPAPTNERGNRPSHRVLAATEPRHEGGKTFWQDIGAAWVHGDGEGFNVVLNFLPLQGQSIVIRVNAPREDEQG
jgi:hypothetical protein